MKKSYIQILIFLSLVLVLSSTKVMAQKKEKDKGTVAQKKPKNKSVATYKENANNISIVSVVKDQNGKPIPRATIYGNEGSVVVKTGPNGLFRISVPEKTDLLIEADGFEPGVFKAGTYSYFKEFPLKASLFLHGDQDQVNIAFGKTKKGDLVNAVSVINPDEFLNYSNNQSIASALSGRVPGLLGSSNIRGKGGALFIVDGFPRDISNINLAEVDQITVLKDINASILYGSAAVNGVVLITTKRGNAYKKQIKVSGYYGLSTPTMLPKYLSSVDYMGLYNEARVNDGLTAKYDSTTIANYRNGNKYRFPSNDYYSKEYIKNIKPYSKVMTELSGGNDVATYYSNIGWERSGSLLNFGEGLNENSNKYNVRGNVDLKINPWIKSSIDAVAVFINDKGPVGSYWSEASTMLPNLFTPLIPLGLISPDDPLILGRKNDVSGQYLLGGTATNLTNAFANGYSGGVSETVQRSFSFSNRVDFDLSQMVKGLAFHTSVSFDLFTRYDQNITNSYSVYLPTWNATADSVASITQFGADTRSGNQNIANQYFERRIGFYGMFDYDRTIGTKHHITSSLLGYANRFKVDGNFQGTKDVNLGFRVGYNYNNKYLLDFSSAYVNSVKLPAGNRGALSPSIGLAWVVSSEGFMKAFPAIDYLKLKASAGVLNSDAGIGGFYYYDNSYTTSGSYSWNEGVYSNNGSISQHGDNSQLGFEKRKEVNVGLEASMFKRSLSIDANVFTSEYYDQITRPSTAFSSFYGDFLPYKNFDSNSYQGAELGLTYNKSFGDFSFAIQANMLYATSKVVKKDEVYTNLYQYRTGNPTDERYGLVANGFFMDQNDIETHATQAFGKVVPGDIKYVDQNNDGIIDGNDQIKIGRSQAPYSGGVNLKISYKNFTLFAQGNGRIGADGYLQGNYYWVDGNGKYTDFILNRWTEATKTTATLPRLSSLANTNNYQSSTFWLYKDNYFTVDRVQLSYVMPAKVIKTLQMKNLSFFVDGSNLFTVSKYKKYRELVIGSEPSYRSFSIGIKSMF